MDWSQCVRSMEIAAKESGSLLREKLGRVIPREKAPKDLVSEADFASQKLIQETLCGEFPEFQFLGEEVLEAGDVRDLTRMDKDQPCWVVDPLDGTINYLHQLPGWGVSIALVQAGRPLAGVIYDPLLDECFAASQGNGATLNGKPVSVSGETELSRGLVAASLPTRFKSDSLEMRRFIQVAIECQALRRLGSAALNLAYVGCGRLDAYWATTVNAWDVAAGVLIAEEAGGKLTSWAGDEFKLQDADFTVAASDELHQELVKLLQAQQP